MAEWVWEARAATGELRKGIMEAESAELVQSHPWSSMLSGPRCHSQSLGLPGEMTMVASSFCGW